MKKAFKYNVNTVISEEETELLNRYFKRIFSLPISRMTVLEVQNALNEALAGKQEIAKSIYDSLMTGELQGNLKGSEETDLSAFIDDYSPQIRIAREVAERGEFMNSFSCDFFQQQNQIYFINRMRRVDGQEYHFLSAPETNIRLAHMFINRLRDLKKSAGGAQFESRLVQELENIKKDTEALLGS